jgi:hypothetical protein
VRCTDCETEQLKLARYCECCGREMSLHETQAEEVDASGADDWAPNPNPTYDLRYQSWVGPSLDDDSSQSGHEPSDRHAGSATPRATQSRNCGDSTVKETLVRVDGINRVITGCVRSRASNAETPRRSRKRRRHR